MNDSARPTIVLASRNAKKIGEIRDLLAPHSIVVSGVGDHPDVPEVVEDGDTFAANAAKKAVEVAGHVGTWAIGEDSGLSVDALDGAPGVYSARYAGEPADDAANNAKLVAALADVPPVKRSAHYTCHVALADAAGNVRLSVEARCNGRIVLDPRGTNGFGYDPYFLLPEYGRTFGELSPIVKRHLSHRARAFASFIPQLVRLLAAENVAEA